MYVTFLADNNYYENTIRSYISAIRHQLKQDGEVLNEDQFLLESIIRSSRIKNNIKRDRMGISLNMLCNLLDQLNIKFDTQPYLRALYRAMFTLGYFCLLRVSELTTGRHPILAKDVSAARNKLKIQVKLRTSKTHNLSNRPQVIRYPDPDEEAEALKLLGSRHCPFTIIEQFISLRGEYVEDGDPFFTYKEGIPIKERQFRKVLKETIREAGYSNVDQFNTHSFRIGRANNLWNNLKLSLDRIKQKGRWLSDIIWNYFR